MGTAAAIANNSPVFLFELFEMSFFILELIWIKLSFMIHEGQLTSIQQGINEELNST